MRRSPSNAGTGTGTIVNDDHAQLLWRNSRTGENAIWQMNGLTVQTTAYINPVADVNWQIVSTADFNDDGIADLLWRNMKTGEDAIWQMNGLTVQTTAYINPVADTNWRVRPFVSASILTSA